tara:strand:+ start:202 stop:495 length:294 start_codon:yes stop_codon:yes gene_type:complete
MADGLEVYNASGTKIISYTDRLVRFVATGTVTGGASGYADVTITGMVNDDTWNVQLGDIPFIFSYTSIPSVYFEKQTNNLRIHCGVGETVDYYVFRV